ncbi:polyisoprenoid-binding protein [bacterium]|nr:MAG: polyisoprenoid-binding protein [bacterium]
MTKLLAALLLFVAAPARATDYTLDPEHSSVQFRIRHLLGKVSGQFTKFEGAFTYVPGKPEAWKVKATIDAASIDTRTAKRDEHLRSADFFDVKKFPSLTFVSKKVLVPKNGKAKLYGDLTIRDVTKPVILDLEIGGEAKDPWGNFKSNFTATGKIKREDFGLTWNEALESGKALVGSEVEITIEAEGSKVQ